MATTRRRRYGKLLPIGELSGVTITRKMLKTGESNNKAVTEFLQFLKSINRGQIQ